MKRSNENFFGGPTIDVARRLIGATLSRRLPDGELGAGAIVAGRIVETEAYLPLVDPSCHAYRGPTKRTATLFGRPGTAYVYLIYGVYYCLNVTTEPPGIGAAVLIRALEPLEGIDEMHRRRGAGVPTEALLSGPGNVCRAMAIDLRCDGADFRSGNLTIEPPPKSKRIVTKAGRRIGLNVATDWPLRFVDANSASVSPFRKRRQRSA